MGNRSRLIDRDSCVAGQAQTINLTVTPPWHSTLIQIGIHYGSVPSTPGAALLVIKDSGVSALYDLVIYDIDPSIDGILSDIVACDVHFVKGDSAIVTYINPDDINVGVELIFREGQ